MLTLPRNEIIRKETFNIGLEHRLISPKHSKGNVLFKSLWYSNCNRNHIQNKQNIYLSYMFIISKLTTRIYTFLDEELLKKILKLWPVKCK